MIQKKYNWGVVAPGRIAHAFAEGLQRLENARMYAVASRSIEKAKTFAEKFGFQKAYGSYDDLYNNPETEILYIANPHNFHYKNVKAALSAGKHVLCEKPLTLNAVEAQELVDLARKKNLFLMEAMWNRFQPVTFKVKELVNSGVIGELLHINADLAFNFPFDESHRIYNPELGGGSLLDLGVYPISYASMFWGEPQKINAVVHKAKTGVDDEVNAVLEYADGKNAQILCASRFHSPTRVDLIGSKGRIKVHGMMIRSSKITLHIEGKDPEIIDCPYEGNAYHYQARAVMEMLDQGKTEHPVMPLDETVAIMRTMDKIRFDAGIFYPTEKR